MSDTNGNGVPRIVFYGVCRDGVIFSARYRGLGATGILRWRLLFTGAAWTKLRADMVGALVTMYQQATAPSRNARDRAAARNRAQA